MAKIVLENFLWSGFSMEGEGQSSQPQEPTKAVPPKPNWRQRLLNRFGVPLDKPLFGLPERLTIPSEKITPDGNVVEDEYVLENGIQTPQAFERLVKAKMYGSDVGKYLLTDDTGGEQAQLNRFEARGLENQRKQAEFTRTTLQDYDTTLQSLIDAGMAERVGSKENEDPNSEQYLVKAPNGMSQYSITRSLVRNEAGQPKHGIMKIQRYWENNLRETIEITVPEKDVWKDYSIQQTRAVKNHLGQVETNYPVANRIAEKVAGRIKELLSAA